MLIGNWRMVEAGGDQIPAGRGVLLTFSADGSCANDKGGGRGSVATYDYDEGTKILRIDEGDGREFKMPVLKIGATRLVLEMGPEECVFERTEDTVPLEAPPAPSGPPTIYQLSFSTHNCAAIVTLNGFPILRSRIDKQGMASQPVNPLLVGTGNRLVIEVTGKGEDARLEGSLSVVGQGDVVEVGGAGDISLPDGDPPQTIVETFDSPSAPFARVLASSRTASAEEALDFGENLRDALRRHDDAAVGALFEPKVELLADAFGEEPATMRAHLAGLLEMAFGSDLAFERADLDAVAHCDRRVWELRRRDGRAFIFSDADGSTTQAPIFAGDLGDGFRVVC